MPEPVRRLTWDGLRQEPFRILFPLGILFGLAGVGHWFAYALGWSERSSALFHASTQASGYMFCFISGFLMTAVPRFSGAFPASGWELGGLLLALALQQSSAAAGQWVAAQLCWAFLLVFLAVFVLRRFVARKAPAAAPPPEFSWIGVAAAAGLAGSALSVLAQTGVLPPRWMAPGVKMAQQGFLLGIVTGVGGFMGPRLMGHPLLVPAHRGREICLHLLAGAFFLASFPLELAWGVRWAALLRAAVVTAELGRMSRCHRPPRAKELPLWLLWISIWMALAGLWGEVFFPRYRVAALHVVFLGGFSLMIFAVATVVALSHSGDPGRLRGPLPALAAVALADLAALACRVAADLAPGSYFPLLAAASALWMAAALGWLAFIFPAITAVPDPEKVRRMHDQAVTRLRTGKPAGG